VVRIVLSFLGWLVACSAALAAERVLWVANSETTGSSEIGGLAGTTRAPWLLTTLQPGRTVLTSLRWSEAVQTQSRGHSSASGATHSSGKTHSPGETELLSWDPRASRLLRFADGEMLVFSVETLEGSSSGDSLFGIFLRRSAGPEGRWGGPTRLTPRAGRTVVLGAPVLRAEQLLLPVVWEESGGITLALYGSDDSGVRWNEIATLPWSYLAAPALAESGEGRLLLVAHRGELVACDSGDGGRTWSAWRGLGLAAGATGIALASAGAGALALTWTDPPADPAQAPPVLQALRLSFSTDGGRTWTPPRALLLRPGTIPVTPALLLDRERLVAACVERVPTDWSTTADRVVCLGMERRELQAPLPIASSRARYGIAPAAARSTLAVLCGHTLARPLGQRRLFVEAYFMRAFAAVPEVFASHAGEAPEWFDPRTYGERALAFADSLAAQQDGVGYWSTGYGAVYIADIGAALGLFPALESQASEEQLRLWEAASRRFVTALEEDGMILPSGAIGVGWPGSAIPRVELRASRVPYLVSTALAGIELHAWLARRSGNKSDRERAFRALEWTLAQVREDGSLPPGPQVVDRRESPFIGAAYVQEGWMAAERLLGREARSRLRAVLPRHVTWLLRQQQPDGSWGSGADGEFARTPASINFLVWYDQRVESRPEVREAIRRAGLRLVDPQQWPATELFAPGKHHEVLRAHAGRVLAALAREGPAW